MPDSDKTFNKEGLKNVLFVAISVCLVCSIVVFILYHPSPPELRCTEWSTNLARSNHPSRI